MSITDSFDDSGISNSSILRSRPPARINCPKRTSAATMATLFTTTTAPPIGPPHIGSTTAPTPPSTPEAPPTQSLSPTNTSQLHQPNAQPSPATPTATPSSSRKYSFPLGQALQNTAASLLSADVALLSARRRISNVSDAVSRKLSNTIGWKTPAVPAPDIITQGRCLCGQYVRGRLRKAGVQTKKMGLHRMRSFVGSTTAAVVRDVYPALSSLGDELERMHPKLYSSVARQVSSRGSGGDLQSAENTSFLLSTIARDLFRTDITWGKVVALFAITGGLALDCVRQGHAEFVPKLIESMADVIEDELVVWISENGGWIGLNVHVKPESSEFSLTESACLTLAGVLAVCLLFGILKFIGFRLIPWMVFMGEH